MKKLLPLLLLLLGVQVLPAQIQYPDNIYPDTLFAPFLNGVASGDPTPSQVVIWTRVDPAMGASVDLDWEMARDDAFAQIVASGNVSTDGSKDHTVNIDVGGLAPDTYYFYRFRTTGGALSQVGRTKTAPSGNRTNVRFAVGSCSSVYSGYFNAYRAIGERNDIDAMVHLGDYIYDFVDSDEAVRVPVPDPVDPENLEELRDRHEYYLLDPDLRLARQMHPWIVIWDNHDIIGEDSFPQFLEGAQAFREYVPMRMPDSNAVSRIYRSFSFGDLVDLMVLDYEQYYHDDPIGNEQSALGTAQRTWLLDALSNSTARWRVIGNQKMFGQFNLQGFPSQIPFGDGPVADSSAWDGHNLERSTILNHLNQNNIDNTIILSGDIHMSFINDLAPDLNNYDDNTGVGSYAVEFIPTSISRGNFDEQGFGGFLATLALGAIQLANPQQVYGELESHGYGILDIRPDVATAEYFYHDKLQPNDNGSFAGGYRVLDGDNHWERNATSSPTVQEPSVGTTETLAPALAWELFPNPARDQAEVQLQLTRARPIEIELLDLNGRVIASLYTGKAGAGKWSKAFDLRSYPAATYLIRLSWDEGEESRRFVLQH